MAQSILPILHEMSYPESISGGMRFGAMLRYLREQSSAHKQEMGACGDASGGRATSVKEMCDVLAERGCLLNVRTYREIEAGTRLPQDCVAFLNAITVYFSLSDEEFELLTLLLAYEILANALGPRLADELLHGRTEPQAVAWF